MTDTSPLSLGEAGAQAPGEGGIGRRINKRSSISTAVPKLVMPAKTGIHEFRAAGSALAELSLGWGRGWHGPEPCHDGDMDHSALRPSNSVI